MLSLSKMHLLVAAVFITAPVLALAQSYDDQRYADRIERLERDLAQIQGQVYRGESSSSAAATGGGENSGKLEVRLSELEEQMRTLTGKVEKAEFETTKLNERLTKITADNDFRFTELEKKGGGAARPEPKASADKVEQGEDAKAAHSLGTISAKKLKTEESTKDSEENTDQEGGKSVRSEYNAAFALLRQSKFDDAQKALKKFIDENGTNPLVGNAYYWLGEAYYAQNAYDKAAVHFLRGYKQFPKGTKAPDSLLKLATSLGKLKKKKEACATFTKLTNEFPDASGSVTQRAADEASHIGCK